MKKRFDYSKALLISGLIFFFAISGLPLLRTLFYRNLTCTPQAVDGKINLEAVSPAGTILLDGDWDYSAGRLTSAGTKRSPGVFVHVPGYLPGYEESDEHPSAGVFASYRLTAEGLDYTGAVTVYIPGFNGAYRAYIDGSLSSESGCMPADSGKTSGASRTGIYPVFLSDSGTHEIVIETATSFPGLYMVPILKDYNMAVRYETAKSIIGFILFGVVLFPLFMLVVFHMLPQGKSLNSAWLLITGIVAVLRMMLSGGFYGFSPVTLFAGLSYEVLDKLRYLLTLALNVLLIFILQKHAGIFLSRREMLSFSVYCAALYLVRLGIPQNLYGGNTAFILIASAFAPEFYVFLKACFSRYHITRHGIAVYWGIILAVAGLIIDCFYGNGLIYPDMSLAFPIMFPLATILISLVLINGTYRRMAAASSQLDTAMSQISMQKEYLEAVRSEIEVIRGIKHDMRHFIRVMKTLCDEGRFAELKNFLDEYSEKTEPGTVPYYCENAVANAILGHYVLKAGQAGIPFRCFCSIPKNAPVSDTDLCTVLGNALENALEACADAGEPRFISAETRFLDNQLIIRIENSYSGNRNFTSGRYLSTKGGKNRGMGIENIKRVIDSYGGFLKTDHDGNVFTLMAAFPCSAENNV